MRALVLLVLAVLAVPATRAQLPPPVVERFEWLGKPGGALAETQHVIDINESGMVAARTFGRFDGIRSFLSSGGALVEVSDPALERPVSIGGLNDAGALSGTFEFRSSGDGRPLNQAFRRSLGIRAPHGVGIETRGARINEGGVSTGRYIDARSAAGITRAYRWTDSSFVVLDQIALNSRGTDINDLGEIVVSTIADDQAGTNRMWIVAPNGAVTQLPDIGFIYPFPEAINNSGHVAGLVCDADCSFERGFLWDGVRYTFLQMLPGHVYSEADDLNDADQVVGNSYLCNSTRCQWALLWQDGVTYTLENLAGASLGAGSTLFEASAIANSGWIAGKGFNAATNRVEVYRLKLADATTITVNRGGDEPDATSTDGVCDTDTGAQGLQCTLRAAIQQANATPAGERARRVTFALAPGTEIRPQTPLPDVARAMTLDGTGQAGGPPVLNGGLLAGRTSALRITAAGVTVRGLAVVGAPGFGIDVDGAAGVRIAGNRLGVRPDGTPMPNGGGALRVTGASADATVGDRGGAPAERNTLFGPLVAAEGARARVHLNQMEVAEADATGLALRAPLDVADDGPTCGTWARTPGSVPAPPRVLALSPTLVRGIAAPGDTVSVYRVAAIGAGNGRYWARRAEPLARVAADAAGAFAAPVALQPGDRVALTALSAEGRTSELSQARRPVVFAPGIGGTWLSAADGTNLWLPLAPTDAGRNARLRRIAMQPDGKTSAEPIVADEVLEGVGPLRIVYGIIHDRLTAAGYAGDPFNRGAAALDQWRYPNDWRRSAAVLATDFRALIDRLTTDSGRRAESAARACQADVIAHSNGGVIAGVYLRRDAAHARDRVHRFVTSGTPYLGADQAFAAHANGYIFGFDEIVNEYPQLLPGSPQWNVAWGDMIAMTRNVPGAYGLLPSRAYFGAAVRSDPSYEHGYALVDLYNEPLVGYDATAAFLAADKTTADGVPLGLARNAGIYADQQAAVHGLIDDWRAYEGPPHIFRHVGFLAGRTEVGWFMGPGREFLRPGATVRDEPGDTDRHRAYRERLRPIFGAGDMTVPLLSATLGRSTLVRELDRSGVDESAWIEEFERYACTHGGLTEAGCRPLNGGGADALDRLVEIVLSGAVVPASTDVLAGASTGASTDAAGPGDVETEIVYVMASAPVAVAVTDAAGRLSGPPDLAAPDAVQHEVPGVRYAASRFGASLALPAGVAYTVKVTSADAGAVVTLVRQRVGAGARAQVLYADQPLAVGGTLTLALAAAGTPAEAPWARDADGDGAPDGAVAPAAVLPGTAAVPALPLPQPSAVDVGAANRSDVRTATLRLPGTGTAGWTFALAESAPWLSLSATAGASPAAVTLTLDPAGLPDGRVSTDLALTLSNGGYTFRAAIPVTLRVGVATAGEREALPTETALAAPHPNPSRGAVTIGYTLAAPVRVRLAVYDALGREVAVLVDAEQPAGTHAAVLDAARLAAGIYVARMTAGAEVFTRRLVAAR